MNTKLQKFEANELFHKSFLRWLVDVNVSLPLEFSLRDIYQVDRLRAAFSFIENKYFQQALMRASIVTVDILFDQLKDALAELFKANGQALEKYWLGKPIPDTVEGKIIVAISAGIMWVIMQTDEEATKLFQPLQTSSMIDFKGLLEEYLGLLCEHVDQCNMGSARRLSLTGGDRRRMLETDKRVETLAKDLADARTQAEVANNKLLTYEYQNKMMKVRIEELEKKLILMQDNQAREFEIMERNAKMRFDEAEEKMKLTIKSLRHEIETLENKNMMLLQVANDANEDVERQRTTSRNLKDETVPRILFEKLQDEKLDLEQRLIEKDNSMHVELSEATTLKEQLTRQKKKYEQQLLEREMKYKCEINELTKRNGEISIRLEEAEKLGLSVIPRKKTNTSPSRIDPDDESMMNFLTQNTENKQMLQRFDNFQSVIDGLKTGFYTENEKLRGKITQLNEELGLLKSKNFNDQSFNKSMNVLNSRDISQAKKGEDISGDFVEKLVKLEQSNKMLKRENKMLMSKIEKDICFHRYQLDLIMSTVMSYHDKE